MDEQFFQLQEDLCNLDRSQLIDIIHNFWSSLRKESDKKIESNQVDIANFYMEQADRLRVICNIKSKYK